MKIPNQARRTIRKWIAEDKLCKEIQKRIAELSKKRRAIMEEYRQAASNLMFKTLREAKKIDYRLSVDDRRNQLNALAKKHSVEAHKLHLAMRKKIRECNIKVEASSVFLGRRRGFLNRHFELRYVAMFHREQIRLDAQTRRKKLSEPATMTHTDTVNQQPTETNQSHDNHT